MLGEKRTITFASDHLFNRVFVVNIVLVIIQVGILGAFFSSLPPEIPLYYSLPWGGKQLAPSLFLFLFPVISLLTGFINIIVLIMSPVKETFLWRILVLTWLLVSVLASIGLINILILIH